MWYINGIPQSNTTYGSAIYELGSIIVCTHSMHDSAGMKKEQTFKELCYNICRKVLCGCRSLADVNHHSTNFSATMLTPLEDLARSIEIFY